MVTRHLFVICAILYAASAVEFQLQSNHGSPLWIGILGNGGSPSLENGGLELQPGQRVSIQAQDNWQGRFWARTGCNPEKNLCETGDCGGNGPQCEGRGGEPPVSLAEITLQGWGGIDFYDISLVDGANIPIALEPVGGQGEGENSCKRAACSHDFNSDCPDELQLIIDGRVVGCKNPQFGRNHRVTRKSTDSSDFFKSRCPDAYSHPYDDESTFSCTAPAYLITFG